MKTHLSISKTIFILLVLLVQSFISLAQDATATAAAAAPAAAPAEATSTLFNGGFLLLMSTIILLMVVIVILGRIVRTLIEEDTYETARKMKAGKITGILLLLMSLSTASFAQDAAAPAAAAPSMIFGMDTSLFWIMMGVMVFEFITVMVLVYILYTFLLRKGLIQPMGSILPKWLQFNTMMGNDIPLEKDAELLTDHDYDGIQELDNGMPPMLKYIFVITIVFAVYYWVDYHVMKASPLQIEEYQAQLEQGAADKAAYLLKAGASVDENTATLLTDATALSTGEKIYATNCVACHGDKGQGGVGPNFTDNYWIHGGDIKSLFKTIKYGVPEKGMRSWQSEIKPGDIQAVASYILKNMTGTNVAGGKAPQGNLFVPGSDSAAAAKPATDSAAAAPAMDSVKAK
ncbi:MAG: c-type cytochrome [Chitinophagaceae bacterium]|nr:c-type cytochrome [Chitinophagaceae bacterium]